MTDQRKTKIIDEFIGWMIEHHNNDEDLFFTLHKVIGLTQEELHDFSIESLDEYFDKQKKENDEATDMITAEDLVEQAVYAANAPKCCSPAQQAENMLGMLGANIMDSSIYHKEEDHPSDEFASPDENEGHTFGM